MSKFPLILILCAVAAHGMIPSRPHAADSYRVSLELDASNEIPKDWMEKAPTDPEKRITLYFATKQQNLDKLEEAFWAVSDPDSPMYGQYMTLDQVTALVSEPTSTAAVYEWLRSNVPDAEFHIVANQDFVRVGLRVGQAEQLLQTSFHEYEHTSGIKINRALQYSVPNFIASHLDFIGGVRGFHKVQKLMGVRELDLEGNEGQTPLEKVVTPKVLTDFYKISPNVGTNKKNAQSVFESLGQYFSSSDLHSFFTKFSVPDQKVAKTVGPNKEYNPGGEANLDIQYIMGVAVNVPTWFWSIDDSETQDPFLDYILAVADTADAPLVHSLSYGGVETMMAADTLKRINVEFQKAGVRGLTLVFASGDDGVASYLARDDPSMCDPFKPDYPAVSPFVTAVGATQFAVGGGEIACGSTTGSAITTGGGFSFKFPRPSYQQAAVDAYLKSGVPLPPATDYKQTGRGYPDVALVGHQYAIYLGGRLVGVDGTSASTPVFAAMLSLINDERLNQGLPPLGFVNPLLYKLAASSPSIFNDVTQGNNKCTASAGPKPVCCKSGFNAAHGWDPLTGLGSVDFSQLKAQAVAPGTLKSRQIVPITVDM
mmetsp:Transcript_18166/g.29846  ORF Transcript_18166/g.29846 Transcript_18166/m.29846 type:complete len:597 (+) Transcript_18166:186-1976(+)